jgi:hypothetical protein
MTTSIRGGMLTGYGNKKRGSSTRYDRQVFMTGSGRLVFATASDFARYRIRSTWSYNDGTWHHLVATLEADGGMALYVDGAMVAGGATTSPVTFYPGFWRVGGDNLERWAPRSEYLSPAPPSYYLQGRIDEFALYPYAISAEAVAAHYAANTLNH